MTAEHIPAPPATVDETIASIRTHCLPLDPELVPLAQTLGRVLREPACADTDLPPFDRSSVDGYAVRLDDRTTRFRIVDEIRAGDWKPRALQPGEAVRIATGGALPGDGLQVVMKEDALLDHGQVAVVDRANERNIRFKGEDAKQGQEIVEIGTTLGPGALALLASIGCTQPRVTRLPKVLHLATGNEIVPPELKPDRGQIRDSNSTLVRTFFQQSGIEPAQLRVGEDRAAIQKAVHNPQSAIASVERQALWRFSGGRQAPAFHQGVLAMGFAAHANERETLWPAEMNFVQGEARLTPLRWQSSGDLTSLATANALVRIAPNQGSLPRGTRLPFFST